MVGVAAMQRGPELAAMQRRQRFVSHSAVSQLPECCQFEPKGDKSTQGPRIEYGSGRAFDWRRRCMSIKRLVGPLRELAARQLTSTHELKLLSVTCTRNVMHAAGPCIVCCVPASDVLWACTAADKYMHMSRG